MRFDHYIPCDLLKPYVSTFVISEATDEKTYKIMPGTGLVIGFQYKGNLSHIHNGYSTLLSKSGITGLHDRYRMFKNSTHVGTVLIYFKEAAAANFFKVPIHELFSESISLDNFMLRSELLILEEQLYEANSDLGKINVVEKFLLSKIRAIDPDNLVTTAIALIYKSKGNIRIKELTEQLHISQSPLEKRFRQVVGTSPKKFASIVRFKNILNHYSSDTSLTELGYEMGFYDQAHFIKEFKNYTGETPEDFFLK